MHQNFFKMHVSHECIEGSINQESSSQKELYEVLLPYLNALCGRYLRDLAHRKDILQETFIIIFGKINQYDASKGEFHSWSAGILINECLKHNRSVRLRKTVKVDDHKSELASISPEVISQLTNEELMRFLKTMPEKFYEVFNLYVIDGFSHAEIAGIVGIKESLSRKRLMRAKDWLKKKPNSLNGILGEYRVSLSR